MPQQIPKYKKKTARLIEVLPGDPRGVGEVRLLNAYFVCGRLYINRYICAVYDCRSSRLCAKGYPETETTTTYAGTPHTSMIRFCLR